MKRITAACAVLGFLAACTNPAGPVARPTPRESSSPSTSPSPAKTWLIAAAGDIACSVGQRAKASSNVCGEQKTANLLAGEKLEAVLTLGDNQYENGTLADYRAGFDTTWGRYLSLLRPVAGNHEYGNDAKGYFAYFGARAGTRGQGWYSYDVGPWHLVALNSNCYAVGGCGASSAQVTWLRKDLAQHRAACTLAYWHHPLFSSGLHGPQAVVTEFWRALYSAGADVVLSGHDHHYERFAPQDPDGRADRAQGIRQFVAGTGGRNLYGVLYGRANSEYHTSRTFGVLFLTLRSASYEWRFVDVAGTTVDSGTGRCH